MVTLLLRSALTSFFGEGPQSQIIPAVFVVEFLSTYTSLTSAVVTSSILSNSNQYSFEELSESPEPLELVEITPNGIDLLFLNVKFLPFNHSQIHAVVNHHPLLLKNLIKILQFLEFSLIVVLV